LKVELPIHRSGQVLRVLGDGGSRNF